MQAHANKAIGMGDNLNSIAIGAKYATTMIAARKLISVLKK